MNRKFRPNFLLVILVFVGYAIIWLSVEAAHTNSSTSNEQRRYLNPPPEYLEYFHFGFRESMADSFWLRWIQDADNCQIYARQLERQTLDVSRQNDPNYNPRFKLCDNSWSFKMLDVITKLAPRFKMPYVAGGITLAVLTEDYVGATTIFERGLAIYPNDWNLAYRAAFHYQFDLDDKVRAAQLLEVAAANGAPSWVSSLAAKLYTQTGQLMLGISALENYRRSITNEVALQEVDKRLEALKRKLAYAQGFKGGNSEKGP